MHNKELDNFHNSLPSPELDRCILGLGSIVLCHTPNPFTVPCKYQKTGLKQRQQMNFLLPRKAQTFPLLYSLYLFSSLGWITTVALNKIAFCMPVRSWRMTMPALERYYCFTALYQWLSKKICKKILLSKLFRHTLPTRNWLAGETKNIAVCSTLCPVLPLIINEDHDSAAEFSFDLQY